MSGSPFGDTLKTFRKRQRLSQQALATRLGVHRNTIWSWEQGNYLPDSKGMVLELARQLSLSDAEERQFLEASLMALSAHWSVPYRRNPFFTGREHILRHLHESLATRKEVALVPASALHGLGALARPRRPLNMPIATPSTTLLSSGLRRRPAKASARAFCASRSSWD